MDSFQGRMLDAMLALWSRERGQVSQREIGERVGARLGREAFSQAAVSRWFQGRMPDWEVLLALAEVCGVDPGWLAFGARSAAPAPPNAAARLAEPAPRSDQSRGEESG